MFIKKEHFYESFITSFDEKIDERIKSETDGEERNRLETLKIRDIHFYFESNEIKSLNCNIGINSLFDMISENSIFYSADAFTVCEECRIVWKKDKLKTLPIHYHAAGLDELQKCLIDKRELRSKCSKCDKLKNTVNIPKRIVVVDAKNFSKLVLNPVDSDDFPQSIERSFKFSKITQELELTDKRFSPKAVIERSVILNHTFSIK